MPVNKHQNQTASDPYYPAAYTPITPIRCLLVTVINRRDDSANRQSMIIPVTSTWTSGSTDSAILLDAHDASSGTSRRNSATHSQASHPESRIFTLCLRKLTPRDLANVALTVKPSRRMNVSNASHRIASCVDWLTAMPCGRSSTHPKATDRPSHYIHPSGTPASPSKKMKSLSH